MTVDELLAGYDPDVRDLALRARTLVRSIMPDLGEQVQPGYKTIVYRRGDRMRDEVCYIAPLKSSVNLGFLRGTTLPDPHALLRGTGKALRHVKLTKLEDLDNPALHELLCQAMKMD